MPRTGLLPLMALGGCLLFSSPVLAQRDARELMRDHSLTLQASDLSLTFIYLRPETAERILTSEEFEHYQQAREHLPPGYSLLALRVVPYREARFDPTRVTFTQRENSHPIGFMDVVDIRGMFTSTIPRGEGAVGLLKVSERIDFRQSVAIAYENTRADFLLPMRWRQMYFQFLDGRPPPQR